MSLKGLFFVIVAAGVGYQAFLKLHGNEAFRAKSVAAADGTPLVRLTEHARAGVDQFSAEPVVLFGASWCTYCAQERRLFKERGVRYVEIDVERNPEAARFMVEVLASPGVPTTVVGGVLLRGYDAGQLERALKTL